MVPFAREIVTFGSLGAANARTAEVWEELQQSHPFAAQAQAKGKAAR